MDRPRRERWREGEGGGAEGEKETRPPYAQQRRTTSCCGWTLNHRLRRQLPERSANSRSETGWGRPWAQTHGEPAPTDERQQP